MRNLPKPTFAINDVYSDCVSGVTDRSLASKLAHVAGDVAAAHAAYDTHGEEKSFHEIAQSAHVGTVTVAEMKELYKSQMSSATGRARTYYDALRNAAPHRKCPLCGVGVVSTLDHYLPQSKYPALTVSPLNLVPSCFDCNKAKLARYPKTAGQQTIHPYFDNFNAVQWVQATIVRGPPFAVTFSTAVPDSWELIDRERVKHHFALFKLAELFASNANDELVLIRSQLVRLSATGGHAAVHGHLLEQASCYAGRLNSWQHALYQLLSNDAWFCDGGFQEIPQPQ